MTEAVRVLQPRSTPSGVVVSLPHSGTAVPDAIAAAFTDEHRAWLRNTDWFLDRLYDFLPELGVTVVAAEYSRYVADVNRDPARPVFGPFFQSIVAASTADGRAIYRTQPSADALQERVERYHRPYHDALKTELARTAARTGSALLLDLHSYMSPGDADIVLGDRNGSTASSETRQIFEGAFRNEGFSVTINDPWSGGYVIRRHADLPRVEALQIELRYTTYLDEGTVDVAGEPRAHAAKWEDTKSRLRRSIEQAIDRCEAGTRTR